jgi:pimeloyl-ACP methyl ester carboxylesterase
VGATLALVLSVAPAGATPEAAVAVADVPVSFNVVNTNRSKASCLPNGKAYQVKGDLVVPQALLRTDRLRSVTLYVAGSGTPGALFWHFRTPPDYDYATAQAAVGHASVVIDLLGYGRSDWPNGNDVCFGSEADIIHQVVAQLRSGRYDTGSRQPVTFQRIALAGHSAGGISVEVEAYSFDDIDALVVADWTDNGVDPVENSFLYTDFERAGQTCALGGEPKIKPEGPGGYAFVVSDTDKLFFDATNEVKAEFAKAYERDPCGLINTIPQTLVANETLVPTIRVPVLVISGDHNLFENPAAQADRFKGSNDVSLAIIPNTGHMLTLERTRESFRRTMSAWLAARGF